MDRAEGADRIRPAAARAGEPPYAGDGQPGVDFENLRVGQSVCIPKDNVPCELPETYTLAATETLEAVAMRFNLPVASLLRANPCLAPQDFEGGVTVILPR